MELLERERCLADLAAWLGSAAQHGGSIALVAGEAGIGKTALLREFSARQPDRHILWGACDAMTRPRPLAPLHDIARQTRGGLLEAIACGAGRDAIFAAALDELDRGAGALVVLEDMHWAEESTLDLLRFLGRRVHLTRALLVVTYRDDETGPRHPLRVAIGDLPRASTRAMSIPPLSESAVAHLASLYGRPATDLHAMTGGNPFLLTETLAADVGTLPVSVRDATLARVGRLSPAARELAEFVAIVRGRAEPWLIRGAGQAEETDVEECLGIGMLRDDDGALAFRHELARRSLEASLSPARRRTLHERALSILASRPGVAAGRLVHHAEAARNAKAVLEFAPAAAARAAFLGAHGEAASYYELALAHAADLPAPERARLHAQLSHECAHTGQRERAIEAGRGALALWRASTDRIREGDALQWLSRLSRAAGDLAAARQLDAAAVEMLEALPPRAELSLAYGNRAELELESCDPDSALAWARRAVELAESLGCEVELAQALNTRGTVRLTVGDSSGWGDLERSLELVQRGAHREEIARAYSRLAALAVTRRRYADACRHLSAGLAYCREQGFDSVRLDLLACRARLRFEQGDWIGTNEDLEAVLRSPCTAPGTRVAALRILGHLRVRRGEPEYAVPLEQARSLCRSTLEPRCIAALAAIRAEAAWVTGDREGVVREAEPAYERLRTHHDPRLKGELAVLLWRAGALREAATDIEEPYALEIAGDWRGAARLWEALECPYEHASLLAWHGAEPEQRAALTMLDQMAAAPAARALRRRMRAQAVRGVPRGLRPSTRRHPLGLTRRQAEILGLLSEGLRNSAIAKRLFVSTKTVDHHVSAILAKLGVPTRTQAVARVHNQLLPRA
jgi:DNA-binding CsgD family transcriptional regulator/tetratricopeptide (TPR) repeat protein